MDISKLNLILRGHCEELDHVTRGLSDGLEVIAALFMASKNKISSDSLGREGGTGRD